MMATPSIATTITMVAVTPAKSVSGAHRIQTKNPL